MIRQTSTPTDLSANLALDSKGLSELRQGAKAGSPEALKGVISDDLHRVLMDPEHIKRGSHCIGPGVV